MRTTWAVLFASTLWSVYACVVTFAGIVAFVRYVLPGYTDLTLTWPFWGGLLVLYGAVSSALLFFVVGGAFVLKVWRT